MIFSNAATTSEKVSRARIPFRISRLLVPPLAAPNLPDVFRRGTRPADELRRAEQQEQRERNPDPPLGYRVGDNDPGGHSQWRQRADDQPVADPNVAGEVLAAGAD